jgi:hypothetical protein
VSEVPAENSRDASLRRRVAFRLSTIRGDEFEQALERRFYYQLRSFIGWCLDPTCWTCGRFTVCCRDCWLCRLCETCRREVEPF